MVSPLVPFLLGAGSQYLADEDASDKLKGDIIDGVSRQIYEVEIPEAQKQINNIKSIKIAMREKYGQGVAEAFDNIGLYESGDQRLVDNEIEKYFTSLENRQSKITRDAFEKTVNELFEKSKLAGEEGQKAAALFKGRFGGQSMLALKTQKLQDRKEKVRELFDDRSNMRDLLVAPDAPKEGVRGFLFGDRVTPQDVPGATGRLTEATQVDVPEPAEAAPRVTFSELGLGQEGADGQIYDFENTRHRELANKASANFERMFKDPSLGTYKFNFDKDDPRYDTAQRIIKGFNEAQDAGYELGIIDYAREQYIDIVLRSQGVVDYLSNYQSMKPSELKPGTTEGTQTGTKVDETQTVSTVEDVGAISAKRAEGETAKEAVEKTEKVSVPKSTVKVNIGTGDAAPDPSELNQDAPGIQLANDGMLYSKGTAVKMFAPLEREIEEASAIAFQIKASDLPDDVKEKNLADLRRDFLQTIAGFGITQYTPQF